MLNDLKSANLLELNIQDYRADFRNESIPGSEAWKLEVIQNFQEPGFATWEEWAKGNRKESLRLLEECREQIFALVLAPPSPMHRARIVLEPLSSYMQWELQALMIRVEAGEDIQVLLANNPSEELLTLPELVVIDDRVLYQVHYDEHGVVAGAQKIVDKPLILKARSQIQELCQDGIELAQYVAQLAPINTTETSVSK